MTIYIYTGKGAGKRDAWSVQYAFQQTTNFNTQNITTEEILEGTWAQSASALVMPGGYDLPYCSLLHGKGADIIKGYVNEGGIYLGICAGAYFGTNFCDFHRGDRGDKNNGQEVLGKRELAFFKGSAVGPTLKPYTYRSEAGSCITSVLWQGEQSSGQGHTRQPQPYNVYFNGGCHFVGDFANTTVLAYYGNQKRREPTYTGDLPAIIACRVGLGKAVLCGIHPEYNAKTFEAAPEYVLSGADKEHVETHIMPFLRQENALDLWKKVIGYTFGNL